ncbi:MAG TPA: gluconokinase [Ktedonobacterales bacterium]|jgi:gluconokinase
MSERLSARACTIGLDLGTTTLKAIAFDDGSGQPVARAAATIPLLDTPDVDIDAGAAVVYAEQDPDAVVEAATAVLAQAVTQAHTAGYHVARVGISAAMHSILPVGADERPLLPALLWMDGRAESEARALWATPEGKALYARTGTPIHAMAPLAKLLWLHTHRPDVFAAAARFVSLKEWIWRRWLGAWEVDASIASATGLYNLRENAWDSDALRLTGIDATRLSTLVPTTTVRAGLRDEKLLAAGLSAQTPFVIGASDGVLANLGLGVISDGAGEASDAMALTIGTSLALRAGSATPMTDPSTRAFCYVLDQRRYVVGAASNSGGAVLEWLGGVLRGATPGATAERGLTALLEVAGTVEAGELFCLPYLTGERAPLWSAQARASFIGLDARHTPAHLMRAACEGVIFNAWWIASGLFALTGRPRAILASGHVLDLPWMRQLVADVFDLPVRAGGDADASARGAAILARIGTGDATWDMALSEASQTSGAGVGAVATPNPARTTPYQERALRFRQLAEALTAR